MESKHDPSLTVRNENPPLLSRRGGAPPLMVSCCPSPGCPARACAIETSMALGSFACRRQTLSRRRAMGNGSESAAEGSDRLEGALVRTKQKREAITMERAHERLRFGKTR